MITSFSGDNRFLSNMVLVPIWYEGVWYKSVEHAYQAAKSEDKEYRETIRNANSPRDAKKLGQVVPLRNGWGDIKYSIMKELVLQKFENNFDFRDRLLATRNVELIEGNNWGDTYWQDRVREA